MKRNCWSVRIFALLSLFTPVGGHAINGPQDALIAAARQHSPEYTVAIVHRDGSPAAVFHDLDGDGDTDIASITVLNEPGVPDRVEILRQPSRLFRTGGPDPLYLIETYFAGDDSVQTVELGRKPALGAIELLSLSDKPYPVGILVELRSLAGTETHLLIFSPGGTIRRVQLQATDRERHQITDLDGDRVLDIVQSRRLPEAGRGYETFMDLLTLQDGSYVVADSFPVVRELQTFLNRAARHMLDGNWTDLLEMTDSPSAETTALEAAFTRVADEDDPGDGSFDFALTNTPISAVVFPGIMENPFTFPYLGDTVVVVFRIECCDSFPRLFAATVQLSANPFESPGFQFLTERSVQQ